MITLPDTETLTRWAERAEERWSQLQALLSPYDDTIARWVSPWITVDDYPPLADGVLTLMAIPVALVASVVVIALFDAFGTLLQRITFRYQTRQPIRRSEYAAYCALQKALPEQPVLPRTPLVEIIGMESGSRNQRYQHWRKLLRLYADAVVIDKKTFKPSGIVLWGMPGSQPKGWRAKRHEARIKRACGKSRLAVWKVKVTPEGSVTLDKALEARALRQPQAALPSHDDAFPVVPLSDTQKKPL